MKLTEITGQITGISMDFRVKGPSIDIQYITTHEEVTYTLPLNALPLKAISWDNLRCKGVRITVETED